MTKQHLRHAPAWLLLLLVTACAGTRARDGALWPTVRSTWPAVKTQVFATVPDSKAMGAAAVMDRAVELDDWRGLRGAFWAELGQAADRGVDFRVESGQISAGVAVSLKERNAQFVQAVQDLVR